MNERRAQESHWQEFVRADRKRASGRESFGRRGACCSSARCWGQAGIRPTRKTVERLAAAIQFSMAHGGKNFLVLTVPDIGKAPAFESEGPVASVIRFIYRPPDRSRQKWYVEIRRYFFFETKRLHVAKQLTLRRVFRTGRQNAGCTRLSPLQHFFN